MRPVLILAILALAGCSSDIDRVSAACARLGAPPGTSDYWACAQSQEAVDQHDRDRWAGLTALGVGIMAQPQPRPWTASCYGAGSFTSCSGVR